LGHGSINKEAYNGVESGTLHASFSKLSTLIGANSGQEELFYNASKSKHIQINLDAVDFGCEI